MRSRGFSLIEAMVSLAILSIAVAGLLCLAPMGTRLLRLSERTQKASWLAMDLAENMTRWTYTDPRLTPLLQVATVNDPAIQPYDMGQAAQVTPRAEFSDVPGDSNASTSGALQTGYQGFRDPEFSRYWNVYEVRPTVTGGPMGKLVQITVRWSEPGVGYHQVTVLHFKRHPVSFFGP